VERVRQLKPDLIVNAAAYTAVDRAESEPELAARINGDAPRILAEEASRLGAALIHYSTDYVFDGMKRAPYVETDVPTPINIYGKSKLDGERGIRATGCRHLILRTSWVYGARGANFLLTMLRLAGERPEVRVVDDQIGAPTWCRDIAAATVRLATKISAGGIEGCTTWRRAARPAGTASRGKSSIFAASVPPCSRFPRPNTLPPPDVPRIPRSPARVS